MSQVEEKVTGTLSDGMLADLQIQRLLDAYRTAREALLPQVWFNFPAGCSVRLRGVASDSWDGVVRDVDEASQRSMSADMVMVKFRNGNCFPVAVDELQRRE